MNIIEFFKKKWYRSEEPVESDYVTEEKKRFKKILDEVEWDIKRLEELADDKNYIRRNRDPIFRDLKSKYERYRTNRLHRYDEDAIPLDDQEMYLRRRIWIDFLLEEISSDTLGRILQEDEYRFK